MPGLATELTLAKGIAANLRQILLASGLLSKEHILASLPDKCTTYVTGHMS